MYNIIELNDKNLPELQSIAKELGIKNVESLKKDELVYGILDEQAIANASKKTTKEKEPRKRSRISVKKEGDKVYTATQDKAQKLEANTPEISTKVSPFKIEPTNPETVNTEKVETNTEQTTVSEETTNPTPKKRGRKSKAKKVAEADKTETSMQKDEKPTVISESPAIGDLVENQQEETTSVQIDDFIAIENLPSEKIELPSELIGKFEATKNDVEVVPNYKFQSRNSKGNNQRRNNVNNNPPSEGDPRTT